MPAFDALPAPQPEVPAVPAAGAAQGPQLLIDQFLPRYDFAVVHAQVFRVPPGVCLRAARNLDKHQPRGISLEHIRRDRILQEALATGADPLHLSLVFNIDHTNAMAYANAARNLLSSSAEQAMSRAARNRHEGTPSTRAGVAP